MAPRRRRTMPSPPGTAGEAGGSAAAGGWGVRAGGGRARGCARRYCVRGSAARATAGAVLSKAGPPRAPGCSPHAPHLRFPPRPAAPLPHSLSGRRCDQPGQLSPHSRPGPHSAPQEGEDRGAVAVERLMGPGAPLKGAASRAELWVLETDPDGGYPV